MAYICGLGCQIEQMDPFKQTHSGINIRNCKKTTNGRVTLTFGPHWLCRLECMCHIRRAHSPNGVVGGAGWTGCHTWPRRPVQETVSAASRQCYRGVQINRNGRETGLFAPNVRTGKRKKQKGVNDSQRLTPVCFSVQKLHSKSVAY